MEEYERSELQLLLIRSGLGLEKGEGKSIRFVQMKEFNTLVFTPSLNVQSALNTPQEIEVIKRHGSVVKIKANNVINSRK